MTAETQDWSRVDGAIGKEGREALNKKTVTIVGLGMGAEIARFLAMNGVGNFILIDPDKLSKSNILRHPAPRKAIGSTKTGATRDVIVSKNGDARVYAYTEDARNSSHLLDKTDLVVIAGLGSDQAQAVIAEKARKNGKTVVVASIYDQGDAGEVLVIDPHNGPCYKCFSILSGSDEPQPKAPTLQLSYGVPIDQVSAVPGLGNHVSMIAGFAVDRITSILLGNNFSPYDKHGANLVIFAINKIEIPYDIPGNRNLGPLASIGLALPKTEDCTICYPTDPTPLSSLLR